MFNNIGEKIKGLAIFFTIIGIIASLIGSIYTWAKTLGFFVGFIILVCGILASWISSFVLYGLGELISKTSDIEEGIRRIQLLNVGRNSDQNSCYNQIIDKVSKDITDEYNKSEYENENKATEDECPNCFAKICKDDTECPNCGYKLRK